MTAAPRRGRPGYDLPTLLDVAVAVFNERGYDGTSMDELARRLGIGKSGIYHHVASKDELLRLALDRALNGLSEVTQRARDAEGPAVDRLVALVRGSVEVLQREQPYVTLLLRVHGNTAVERAALTRRRAIDRTVAQLVAEAADDGDLRPDLDARVTARLLFGMVNSIVEWRRPRGSGVPASAGLAPASAAASADQNAPALADAVCAIAFDGLRVRPG